MNQLALVAAFAVLMWTAVVALAATSLTILVRNAPFVRDWVQEAKRPWACNVCMPLYTCAAAVVGLCAIYGRWEYALAYLPAYVLTKLLLDKLAEPPNEPFVPPLLVEEDLEEPLFMEEPQPQTNPTPIPPVLRENRKV